MKEAKNSIPTDCEKTPMDCCDSPNFKKNSVANSRLGQCDMMDEMYSSENAEMDQDINE